ncbi:AzlD domain-containing protein [uncultured Psychromonas sp.]|uniref:AzlD domain-containing protein n=1 Tax=uncultured Psychromonas sp. TaxID=173974 RepID=UPI002622EFCE|nr:AzlD domain-containing protein [uncultured Psychromonas sp.]
MNEFWLILGMFVITFGIRFVMFAFAGKITFPVWMQQSLKFVPPAVLTAIIVPAVVMPFGEMDFSFSNVYLLAAIISVIISLVTKSLLKTIFFGMLVFLLLKFLMI